MSFSSDYSSMKIGTINKTKHSKIVNNLCDVEETNPGVELVDRLPKKMDKHDLADKMWQKMEGLHIHKGSKSRKCNVANMFVKGE